MNFFDPKVFAAAFLSSLIFAVMAVAAGNNEIWNACFDSANAALKVIAVTP